MSVDKTNKSKESLKEPERSISKVKYYLSDDENSYNKENSVKIKKITKNIEDTKTFRKNLTDILEQINFSKQISKRKLESSSIKFREKIDELNLCFYLETEKYMKKQIKENKCIENLFGILFEEINLYSQEIDRLSNKKNSKEILNTTKEFETKTKLIQSLKDSKISLEYKLSNELEKNNSLRIQNQYLKKENEVLKQLLNSNNIKFEHINSQKFSDITNTCSNNSNEFSASAKKKEIYINNDSSNNFNLNDLSEQFNKDNYKSQANVYLSNLNDDFCNNSNHKIKNDSSNKYIQLDPSMHKKLYKFINKDKSNNDLHSTKEKNSSILNNKK